MTASSVGAKDPGTGEAGTVSTRDRGVLQAPPLRPNIIAGAMLAVAGIAVLYAGRHLTFFYDEWSFVLTRRGRGVNTYLDPHNGHLVLFPVVVYKVLVALFGLRHYWPYRLVEVALHLLCCWFVYVLARRRLGPTVALAPLALILFMGTAWQVLLWPFQIGYIASVTGGLGALILLEGERPRDAVVAALLTWAVVSSGVGLAFVVACAVWLLAHRDPWRRFWVVVVPLVVFGIWYLGWSSGDHTSTDALLGAPQYVASAAAAAVAGIAGLDASWGPALVVAFLLAAVASWRLRARGEPTPMLLALLAGALTFWILAAATRATSGDPASSRYLYVGAAFILVGASEVGFGSRLTGLWALLAGLLVVGAVISNLHTLRAGERGLRQSDTSVRTAFAAVEIAAPIIAPGFQADPVNAPQALAGPYLAAVRDLGSPALTPRELLRAPQSEQLHADSVLEQAEQLAVPPAAAAPCRQSAGPQRVAETVAPPGTLVHLAVGRGGPATVSIRRFDPGVSPQPFATLPTASAATVRLPRDRAAGIPWHVRITSTVAPVCVS